MPITIDGAGTITGISVGGLPDEIITASELATNSVTTVKISNANVTTEKLGSPYTIMTSQTVSVGVTTALDFTGIPSWAKRITILMDGLSLSGTDNFLVQLGDSGGFEITGYSSAANIDASKITSTAGFIVGNKGAASVTTAIMTIYKFSSSTNQWISTGVGSTAAGETSVGSGTKTLSDTLTQVRVTRTGSNTFDAGSINVVYEG